MKSRLENFWTGEQVKREEILTKQIEMKMENKKPNRNGVFIGGYVPPRVKEFVKRRAKTEFKTVSQVLKEILIKEIAADFDRNNKQNK